ncbi:MAG: tRNA threonylcarbamoyladenosine dehydratase [Bacteroidales bacterium]|nr:tRNA threonylcarbamoyladenosine dehydratase [Bacteroidales bacterium]MCR5555571.1 tRNA threonylcarbamoyladenosine dehydratase [Bacteroidales bacterium]
MDSWQQRTALLIGQEGVEKLSQKHVLVVGVGGVGAYAAEMLVRAGIGKITIVDGDCVENTNRNRQLLALTSTLGQPKVDVFKQRLLDINPRLQATAVYDFLQDEKIPQLFENQKFDFLIDAIDSVAPKTYLIAEAVRRQVPVVSAMGAGGKCDPAKIQVADISKTYQCHLAAVVRKRLKLQGITKGVMTVFSAEPAAKLVQQNNADKAVGTISYMPAIFGCWCASLCLRELLKIE